MAKAPEGGKGLAWLLEDAVEADLADDVERASFVYRKALESDPRHIGTRAAFAGFLNNSGFPAEAEVSLREGLRFRPESVSLRRLLAEALALQQRYDEAIDLGRELTRAVWNVTEFRMAYAGWLMHAAAGHPGGDGAKKKYCGMT